MARPASAAPCCCRALLLPRPASAAGGSSTQSSSRLAVAGRLRGSRLTRRAVDGQRHGRQRSVASCATSYGAKVTSWQPLMPRYGSADGSTVVCSPTSMSLAFTCASGREVSNSRWSFRLLHKPLPLGVHAALHTVRRRSANASTMEIAGEAPPRRRPRSPPQSAAFHALATSGLAVVVWWRWLACVQCVPRKRAT